jgi:hypothetical protein
MKMRYFILATVVAVLSACSAGYVPKQTYGWEKYGVPDNEIVKAILECGYPSPYPALAVSTSNDSVLIRKCMLSNGFKIHGFAPCSQSYEKDLPACQSDAVIPTRSIERRLNSLYCSDPQRKTRSECQFDSQKTSIEPIKQNQTAQSFDPALNRQMQERQFQQQVQQQSNSQMNELLKNTAPKR